MLHLSVHIAKGARQNSPGPAAAGYYGLLWCGIVWQTHQISYVPLNYEL